MGKVLYPFNQCMFFDWNIQSTCIQCIMAIYVLIVIFLIVLDLFFLVFFYSFPLGVNLDLFLLTYTTATVTPDQRHICKLHHRSLHCWILNPLSKATIKPVSSWLLIRFVSTESQWEILFVVIYFDLMMIFSIVFGLLFLF